jgi:DNA-binding NarL/FixJ family response regulator
MTPYQSSVKTVLVCDLQPVIGAGLMALFNGHPDLTFVESTNSLFDVRDVIRTRKVDLVLLDKSFGPRPITEWLTSLKESGLSTPGIVVWGAAMNAAETRRLVLAGVRGVLLKTAGISSLVSCLRTVTLGRHWFEDSVLRDKRVGFPKNSLTPREQQVLELAVNGSSNPAIAQDLGIRSGTVKIHMKHIFEKTGVRGRNSLALASYIDDLEMNPDAHSVATAS